MPKKASSPAKGKGHGPKSDEVGSAKTHSFASSITRPSRSSPVLKRERNVVVRFDFLYSECCFWRAAVDKRDESVRAHQGQHGGAREAGKGGGANRRGDNQQNTRAAWRVEDRW